MNSAQITVGSVVVLSEDGKLFNPSLTGLILEVEEVRSANGVTVFSVRPPSATGAPQYGAVGVFAGEVELYRGVR